MDVKNCRNCGRLFNYMGGEKVCPACREELEKKFQDVKKYIEDHPSASMGAISEDCDVSVNQLRKWVREERLSFTQDSPITIDCESCGAPIRSGKYCDKCKLKIQSGLESMMKKPEKESAQKKVREREKMRFLDI